MVLPLTNETHYIKRLSQVDGQLTYFRYVKNSRVLEKNLKGHGLIVSPMMQ